MRARHLLSGLGLALALGACQGQGPGQSQGREDAFGKRVHAYLLAHPEVLREMAQRLDAREAAAEQTDQKRAQAQLPALKAAIERDPLDFVANPAGAVTVTEFYDYRCPHCADAAPQVLALIHDNPKVRFVFKEMPIFGAVSEHAARAALAVRRAGGDSVGLYQAFMTARPLQDGMIDPIAIGKGARPADLAPGSSAAAEATAHLAQTGALFTKLALGGTPAFIVGDEIILGANMPAVQAGILKARVGQ